MIRRRASRPSPRSLSARSRLPYTLGRGAFRGLSSLWPRPIPAKSPTPRPDAAHHSIWPWSSQADGPIDPRACALFRLGRRRARPGRWTRRRHVHSSAYGATAGARPAVRLLAVGSDVRSALAPEVPTFAEEGLAGINIDLWYALLAPADTPADIIGRYNQVVNDILSTPKVRDALSMQGLSARGGSPGRPR